MFTANNMVKHTKPDANQSDIEEALQHCGFTVIDLHNVPVATQDAKLEGLPDLMAVDCHALTIFGDFDHRQVLARLEDLPEVRIIEGGVIPIEVKTDKGKLGGDQRQWWIYHGLVPLVMQTKEQVFKWVGREVINATT